VIDGVSAAETDLMADFSLHRASFFSRWFQVAVQGSEAEISISDSKRLSE
jgi:hypothetical protein